MPHAPAADTIHRLSSTLNQFPGIETAEVCEPEPDEVFVRFLVDIVRGGWRSLQLIAHVALDDKRWQLRAVGGDAPEDLAFILRGTRADPAALADVLAQSINDLYNAE